LLYRRTQHILIDDSERGFNKISSVPIDFLDISTPQLSKGNPEFSKIENSG
jgi:hypothetical protein